MATYTIYAGTIGFALVTLVVGWALFSVVNQLLPLEEPDDRDAGVRGVRPSGQVAQDRGGDHNRVLLQVQQDLARDCARRRREAADLAVFHAVKRGQVGPSAESRAVHETARVVPMPRRSA
jgi:hypothetical protein